MDSLETYENDLLLIKKRVYQAQHKAFHQANKELIALYWDLGKVIALKQEKEEWGKSTVERLAKDLQAEFPGVSGFGERNLFRMRAFYLAYQDYPNLTPLVSEIPWSHNFLIFQKIKESEARKFYLLMTQREGWSKRFLEDKIKQDEYQNYLEHINNFPDTLSEQHLSKVHWDFKDEYNLSFLNLRDDFIEQELEQALVDNICKFLSEMGGEFSFVGRQYKLSVGEKDFFIDLLFYHRELQSLVAIELKRGEFKPEHLGQIEFYLTALDKDVRKSHENPSVGIIAKVHHL